LGGHVGSSYGKTQKQSTWGGAVLYLPTQNRHRHIGALVTQINGPKNTHMAEHEGTKNQKNHVSTRNTVALENACYGNRNNYFS